LWRLRRATAIVFPTAQNPRDLHGNHLTEQNVLSPSKLRHLESEELVGIANTAVGETYYVGGSVPSFMWGSLR
jgi:hypothetical protein